MKVSIYLKSTYPFSKEEVRTGIASVDLEVVPKGIYQIDGVAYMTVGSPKFIIERSRQGHQLIRAELTVEKMPDDPAMM